MIITNTVFVIDFSVIDFICRNGAVSRKNDVCTIACTHYRFRQQYRPRTSDLVTAKVSTTVISGCLLPRRVVNASNYTVQSLASVAAICTQQQKGSCYMQNGQRMPTIYETFGF